LTAGIVGLGEAANLLNEMTGRNADRDKGDDPYQRRR
jgi:hypothetical protein